MASEDDDISALLSETNVPTGPVEISDDLSSVILQSVISPDEEIELSPEEAAWADSCLVFNEGLADDDWESMKEALLDALSAENSIDLRPIAVDLKKEQENHISEATRPAFLSVEEPYGPTDIDMEQHCSSDEDKESSVDGTEEMPTFINAARGLHSNGGVQRDGNVSDGASSEAHEDIESRDNIFTVWDLETSFSSDEDELSKELKKLLKGSSMESPSLSPEDMGKTVSQVNIDELVADLSDLSLHPFDD